MLLGIFPSLYSYGVYKYTVKYLIKRHYEDPNEFLLHRDLTIFIVTETILNIIHDQMLSCLMHVFNNHIGKICNKAKHE